MLFSSTDLVISGAKIKTTIEGIDAEFKTLRSGTAIMKSLTCPTVCQVNFNMLQA